MLKNGEVRKKGDWFTRHFHRALSRFERDDWPVIRQKNGPFSRTWASFEPRVIDAGHVYPSRTAQQSPSYAAYTRYTINKKNAGSRKARVIAYTARSFRHYFAKKLGYLTLNSVIKRSIRYCSYWEMLAVTKRSLLSKGWMTSGTRQYNEFGERETCANGVRGVHHPGKVVSLWNYSHLLNQVALFCELTWLSGCEHVNRSLIKS